MITIVVLLPVRDADSFGQFERRAAVIMVAYGGRIDAEAGQHVDEVHVLKFPDQEAFDRYRSDDGLLALANLREKAISQTTVYVSAIEVDYSAQE